MAEPWASRGVPLVDRFGEPTVLILGTALLLTAAGIAAFPCWPHSRRFGYGPSAAAAVLLILVAIVAASHKQETVVVAGPTTHIGPSTD